MKIARFIYKNRECYGIMEGEKLLRAEGSVFEGLANAGEEIDKREAIMLPPIMPTKVVCIGLNYADHARELNMPLSEEPILFLKPQTTVIGPGKEIRYPKGVGQLDYEAELAVVIKEKCYQAKIADAQKFILGYTCINDVTARDLQKRDGQWTRSKSFDTFCPLGPYIATGIDPYDLMVELYLNGERKQSSNTANFIFSIERLINFVSNIMTLNAGDVIATGTPPGVGPMKPGDTVEVRIEGIGSLINKVVNE